MATARIIHTWPDGCVLKAEISVATSYPDAVSEARAQVVAMYREALGLTVETLGGDDEE